MIYIELSEAQARLLEEALGSHLRGLRDEIVHTDRRELREAMKVTFEELERIRARLEAMRGSGQAYV
jgi:hypothetical protein